MAGRQDWIPMDREICIKVWFIKMRSRIKSSRNELLGALTFIWFWADRGENVDGHAVRSGDAEHLDAFAELDGLYVSMERENLIRTEGDKLVFVDYFTNKMRMQTKARVQRHRDKKEQDDVNYCNASETLCNGNETECNASEIRRGEERRGEQSRAKETSIKDLWDRFANHWTSLGDRVAGSSRKPRLTDDRKRHFSQRIKESVDLPPFDTLPWFEAFVDLCGKWDEHVQCFPTSTGWIPTMKWILRPDTLQRIADGDYRSKISSHQRAAQEPESASQMTDAEINARLGITEEDLT
jgi:hypothetical protein